MIQNRKHPTIIHADCICKNRAYFFPYITYKNETVFKAYEGIIIGKCSECGMLKTLASATDPTQSHIETYLHDEKQYQKLFEPIIEVISKNKSQAKILDVGCSNGILLRILRKHKYDVWGVEPNKNAYQAAQEYLGNRVLKGTTKDLIKKRYQQYDIIIYNHVMEHVIDINAEFTYIKKLLAPNGLLIIGVPNTNNFVFLLRKKFWESLLPLEHIWHFSDKYLMDYIRKKEFNIIQTFYSNHARSDYSLLKRLYFRILCILNILFRTGEAVVIVAKQ